MVSAQKRRRVWGTPIGGGLSSEDVRKGVEPAKRSRAEGPQAEGTAQAQA